LLSLTTKVLARLRPVAPPAVWFALVAFRSAAGSGPLLTRPRAKRALVLAPHPDDETIGCGGCVALLVEDGTEVQVLLASSGEASVADPSLSAEATALARTQEFDAACSILGARVARVLKFPDGELTAHQEEMTASVDVILSSFRPDIVFVPWPLDDHPDHRAVCRALAGCHNLRSTSEIWCYEVWSALTPNRVIDVSPWWDQKVKALSAHSSAAVAFDTSAHLALNRWRSIAGLGGGGHAEAYLVLGPDQFHRLVADLP